VNLLDITELFLMGTICRINKNVYPRIYFDIPIDFTYHLKQGKFIPKDFRCEPWGFKIGYLYNVQTKYFRTRFSDGLKRKVKDSQNYAIRKIPL